MLSMTGFELRISGVRSNCSTNWATTTAQESKILIYHYIGTYQCDQIMTKKQPNLVFKSRPISVHSSFCINSDMIKMAK